MAMVVGSSHFTHNSLMDNYPSLEKSKFSKIYKELDNSCTEKDLGDYDTQAFNCKQYEIKEGTDTDTAHLLRKLHRNLKKIHSKVNIIENSYFNDPPNDEKEYCIYLKYLLYYELTTKHDYKSIIHNIFEKWTNYANGKDDKVELKHCTFNKLNSDDIEKLKSIYHFKLIFYDNLKIFNEAKNKPCRYLSELGKGLKAYSESISRCSIRSNEDNYCREFKEFQNIYNFDKLHLQTAESDDYTLGKEETVDCPLVIASMNEPLRLMYKEGIYRWYLSDQPLNFLNTSIISASSAIGTTVGISAFLFYLYKFTNIGSLFGHRNKKDNKMFLNVDQGTHDFTFPILAPEHNNFGNNEYKISYYSSDNS
ncbi:PIR Superfamily Protein [Plasmodium ovale wallikeri]|uniref:PIR Superfamily Protein n=2 Tax=Plasmodium ovale TaxID=36330 RepID=A0A1A9AHU9_PLAOA|nr:PIR Superfamily Protein [Plasmodium ovale wallikeri]SBT56031.1 PIR Superfamily Protein [Plasmodium ovale wallikeri]SBT73579.1 PIR protein [Plasmodium ovale]